MQSPRTNNTACRLLTFTINELTAALMLVRDENNQGYHEDLPAFTLRKLGGALTLISDQNEIFTVHEGHGSEELPSPATEECPASIASSCITTGSDISTIAPTSATEGKAAQERGSRSCDVVVQLIWSILSACNIELTSTGISTKNKSNPALAGVAKVEPQMLKSVATIGVWRIEYCCENEVNKARNLVEKAHSLSTSAGSLEGPYTEQLQVGLDNSVNLLSVEPGLECHAKMNSELGTGRRQLDKLLCDWYVLNPKHRVSQQQLPNAAPKSAHKHWSYTLKGPAQVSTQTEYFGAPRGSLTVPSQSTAFIDTSNTVTFNYEALLNSDKDHNSAIYNDHLAETSLEDYPLLTWMEEWDHFLLELIHMEGHGDFTVQETCQGSAGCTNALEFRCEDCLGTELYCKACTVEGHIENPTHRIEYWNGQHFEDTNLRDLGLRLQLGHPPGEHCSNPS
ncbi:hypothetical protein BDR03DRAFT_987446 [Suillus americanus]|nr:hypothetical protein BDR03DRAFT_987446 [Suillus americanus]